MCIDICAGICTDMCVKTLFYDLELMAFSIFCGPTTALSKHGGYQASALPMPPPPAARCQLPIQATASGGDLQSSDFVSEATDLGSSHLAGFATAIEHRQPELSVAHPCTWGLLWGVWREREFNSEGFGRQPPRRVLKAYGSNLSADRSVA